MLKIICTMTAKTRAIPSLPAGRQGLHRDIPIAIGILAKENRTWPDASSGNTTSPYCRAVSGNAQCGTKLIFRQVQWYLVLLIITKQLSIFRLRKSITSKINIPGQKQIWKKLYALKSFEPLTQHYHTNTDGIINKLVMVFAFTPTLMTV
jgi:hypothetical protein